VQAAVVRGAALRPRIAARAAVASCTGVRDVQELPELSPAGPSDVPSPAHRASKADAPDELRNDVPGDTLARWRVQVELLVGVHGAHHQSGQAPDHPHTSDQAEEQPEAAGFTPEGCAEDLGGGVPESGADHDAASTCIFV